MVFIDKSGGGFKDLDFHITSPFRRVFTPQEAKGLIKNELIKVEDHDHTRRAYLQINRMLGGLLEHNLFWRTLVQTMKGLNYPSSEKALKFLGGLGLQRAAARLQEFTRKNVDEFETKIAETFIQNIRDQLDTSINKEALSDFASEYGFMDSDVIQILENLVALKEMPTQEIRNAIAWPILNQALSMRLAVDFWWPKISADSPNPINQERKLAKKSRFKAFFRGLLGSSAKNPDSKLPLSELSSIVAYDHEVEALAVASAEKSKLNYRNYISQFALWRHWKKDVTAAELIYILSTGPNYILHIGSAKAPKKMSVREIADRISQFVTEVSEKAILDPLSSGELFELRMANQFLISFIHSFGSEMQKMQIQIDSQMQNREWSEKMAETLDSFVERITTKYYEQLLAAPEKIITKAELMAMSDLYASKNVKESLTFSNAPLLIRENIESLYEEVVKAQHFKLSKYDVYFILRRVSTYLAALKVADKRTRTNHSGFEMSANLDALFREMAPMIQSIVRHKRLSPLEIQAWSEQIQFITANIHIVSPESHEWNLRALAGALK